MDKLVCSDCWRRDNLTFAQRLDPAFVTPGPVHRCAMHRNLRDELLERPGPASQAA
ncbi:hypothetical protein [Nocardia transvalensis]|uniref:hypothetical protein n=1 Tax=Nocardia transvalensis TaxID=37333 RepID=UPI00189613B6|nr:hypothetical protein [Nocardia transvalensis]MBF6331670.1 hypothetical protein [Nocardia transvalensis]